MWRNDKRMQIYIYKKKKKKKFGIESVNLSKANSRLCYRDVRENPWAWECRGSVGCLSWGSAGLDESPPNGWRNRSIRGSTGPRLWRKGVNTGILTVRFCEVLESWDLSWVSQLMRFDLMPRLLRLSDYQQPWYCPCDIGRFLSSKRKDFNNLDSKTHTHS